MFDLYVLFDIFATVKLLEIVAHNIRFFRKQANLTQEALGYKVKLHPNYLGRVERGEDTISVTNLEKIAKVLKVDAFKLLVPDIDRTDVLLQMKK